MKIKVDIKCKKPSVSEVVSKKEARRFAEINYPNLVCNNCEVGVLYNKNDNYFCCSNCENKSRILSVDPKSPFKPFESS